jgi:hypothetical protein
MGFIIGLVVAFVILIASLFTSPAGIEIVRTALKPAGGA